MTNEILHTCQHCGQIVDELDLETVHMHDGTTEEWCEECRTDNATQCHNCGNWYECDDDFVEVLTNYNWRYGYDHEWWCPTCAGEDASVCDDCQRHFSNDYVESYTLWTGDSIELCGECADNNYRTCYVCGDLVHVEDTEWDDWDEPYCPNHAPSENLHSYGQTDGCCFWTDDGECHNLTWRMPDELRKLLYLGIELETDHNDNASALADDIVAEFDDRYVDCKRDGSLHDNGVEIVSQPMTPNYHLNSGFWDRIVEIVRAHGGKSHDAGTCGLHIHISRDFFSDSRDAAYRMDRLFHRFKSELVNFSRRRSFHYCRLEDDDLAEIKTVEERKRAWYEKKRWCDRYQAINDENYATIEVRLWRGTLNIETFMATVELTAGLAIVCNSMSDELADTLTWSMVKLLVRFALEQAGISHAELDSYLTRRGL